MNGPCKEFADRIVDYVDGELPEAEAQAVAQHLATCEPCRRTAEALDRSLGQAKVLWSDNLGDKGAPTQSAAVPRFHRIRVYAVAASVLIVASVVLFTVADRHPRPSAIRIEDVERQVAKAGAAAQLLAATQILAQCEGTESIVQEQYRYILAEYGGTPAAESIRTKYNL
ncbi:MAG: anti-sigma factor [Solirubrobacterales bacterium]